MRVRFELNPQLSKNLKQLASDTQVPIEFLVEDAINTALVSMDRNLIAGLREDYAEAVEKETTCGVVTLEMEGAL